MNIWLIDDDDITNMLHQFFLEEYFPDASIVVFSQAELALAALAENQAFPDHIFLDLNMPVMDGWEFLDAYSEMTIPNSNNIHIHILTSSLDPNDFAKAEQSPFVHGIISKPLEIEKVQFLKNWFQTQALELSQYHFYMLISTLHNEDEKSIKG